MNEMRGWLQRLFAVFLLVTGWAHAAPVADYVLGAGDTVRVFRSTRTPI
jgi:protein involved in polysaccharide export with SLBB domain